MLVETIATLSVKSAGLASQADPSSEKGGR